MEKIKPLFFAQFLGQELTVVSVPENISYPNYPFDINEGGLFLSGIIGTQIIVRRIAEDLKDRFCQTALLLRSVDQLTDDECLIVAALFDLSEEQIMDTDLREWIEALFDHTAGYYIDGYTGNQLLSAIDYLRSIGILLRFTYLDENNKPVTLQPDEIIAMGWAKI